MNARATSRIRFRIAWSAGTECRGASLIVVASKTFAKIVPKRLIDKSQFVGIEDNIQIILDLSLSFQSESIVYITIFNPVISKASPEI